MKATKGSALEQEQKSLRVAKIIFGVITILAFCMCYFGLFDTNLAYFTYRAANGAHIAGVLLFILCGVSILAGNWIAGKAHSDTLWYIIWIGLLVFALCTSCGFNFGDPIK